MVQEALRHRKNNPIFFIDIAVPRNVAPEVNQLSNVFLYDVDDLGAVVEANQEERMREAERARILVEKDVAQFIKVTKSFEVFPTLSSLSKKFENICQIELEKAFEKLPQLDADAREVVEHLAESIVKKVLHDPMVTLKEPSPEADSVDYPAMVRKLFRLDEI
jgi:glutamyl-tRNA reductase